MLPAEALPQESQVLVLPILVELRYHFPVGPGSITVSRLLFENPRRGEPALLFHWNLFTNPCATLLEKWGLEKNRWFNQQIRCNLGIFPENVPICQGKLGSRR